MEPSVTLAGLTLHVKNVEESLKFYQQIPGASLIVHRPGQIAFLQIGGGRLGLLRNDDIPFHVEIDTQDVDAIYRHLLDAGLTPESPPEQKPWGERDFYVKDPDGNTVEFSGK